MRTVQPGVSRSCRSISCMLAPVMHRDARREVLHAVMFLRLVGHHHDACHTFGGDLAGDLRHRQRAVERLAAGHRDRVVEQDLVGDVDAGGDRGADRHVAGMEIGAVADIGEDMLFLGERRLADPGDALAAHLAEGVGAAVHPHRQCVAADAAERAAAVDDLGRGVVRAAGAEIGPALGGDFQPFDVAAALAEVIHAAAQLVVAGEALEARADRERDLGGGELAVGFQKTGPGRIALAEHRAGGWRCRTGCRAPAAR